MTASCPKFSRSDPISNVVSPCQTMYSNATLGKRGHQIVQAVVQCINLEGRTYPDGIAGYISEKEICSGTKLELLHQSHNKFLERGK